MSTAIGAVGGRAAVDDAGMVEGVHAFRGTDRVETCMLRVMSSQRLNITLDGEHATKLARLAARVHVNEGTLARSLLSSAIDEADPDPVNIVAVLDGIDGAWDRAQQGLEQARVGDTVVFEDL